MPRPVIETGSRCCQVCHESFYRKEYQSGRNEETDRFNDRATCDKEDCKSEYLSWKMKEVWDDRKSKEPEKVKSVADVWLSKRWGNMNSVRCEK